MDRTLVIRMLLKPSDDDLGRGEESLTYCGRDTLVYFQGDGINYGVRLDRIISLTVEDQEA